MSEVTSETKKEDWMNSKWRPMMGWMYMVVCMFDMIVFPVLWSLLQTLTHTPITQWNPLTLQGAGLFHIAMGAVLGIAAFGRTQEKLNGANNGGAQTPTTGSATGATAPSAPQAGFGSAPGSFGSATPAPSSFGTSTGFGAPATGTAEQAPAVVTGFGGKPAPAPTTFPAI
jgi:hypothetical protein